MQVIIPFDGRNPKTRLADCLTPSERRTFARAMLKDVIGAVRAAGFDPIVLTPSPLDIDCACIIDDQSLSNAVNSVISERCPPIAVFMGDLALLTDSAVKQLVGTPGEVVLAPGVGGGTNAIVVRDTSFSVAYHRTSYLRHRSIAEENGLTVANVDSWRLAVDIDEPQDLVEVLVHSDGEAREWLNIQGFSLSNGAGRTQVTRAKMTR